ncbi:phosphate ABC transporter substrate-binding protein PstS [Haloglycomyces albus]|uniref:phosphate ABC transporter substrate-binding protein PstS n=1 Tax=Haloglycomyces albus TaxID=526067 RepID=UPI0004A2EFDA|nr:phosphate ABC transporter substrate-binding protein PstS [Haloglycomyces albus]
MTMRRRAFIPVLAASSLAFSLAACGGDEADEVIGTGASFPDAYYQAAIAEFNDDHDFDVTYDAVGSGTGKSDFGEGLNDFAGTDSLVGDGDGPEDGSYQYIPTVAAPITIPFNLEGVEELNLGQETLAKIFQGDITSWSHDEIAAANEGVELPETDITIAHRSDGSGTTGNFTRFLDEATESWTLGAGDTAEWPSNAVGGDKNTGVAQVVQDTDGAIGYVDYADATELGLTTANVENKDGNFVAPTLEGTTAGLDGAEVNDDLSFNPLNAAGEDAYPITAPTYLLLHTDQDGDKADQVKEFVTWLLTDGQQYAEENGYAALPDGLAEQALTAVEDTLG